MENLDKLHGKQSHSSESLSSASSLTHMFPAEINIVAPIFNFSLVHLLLESKTYSILIRLSRSISYPWNFQSISDLFFSSECYSMILYCTIINWMEIINHMNLFDTLNSTQLMLWIYHLPSLDICDICIQLCCFYTFAFFAGSTNNNSSKKPFFPFRLRPSHSSHLFDMWWKSATCSLFCSGYE